ncbi:histidine-tRNA ligase-like, partial [Trifolium medium]|nr:histidine-tRNA ligase-like [Trifolium medium]
GLLTWPRRFRVADVTDFYLTDSRSKEEVGVAAYMKKLLNNSKLVVKNSCEASKADATVLNIVTAHGMMMREKAKLLHSRIPVDLNSDHNLGKAELLNEPVCCELFSLATALRLLGQCSFARARRNLLSIGSDNLKGLGEIFQKECPTDASLVSNFNESFKLYSDRVYDKFAHEINVLFSLVWKIVAWELVSAYALIEAAELNEMIGNVLENGENSKVDKNKKAGLGEGTSKILALIKERLQSEKKSDVDNSRLLETWVADFQSFLYFAKPGFNDFLLKIKDVVESRSRRSQLKIPK